MTITSFLAIVVAILTWRDLFKTIKIDKLEREIERLKRRVG
jgi:hypothetical protein